VDFAETTTAFSLGDRAFWNVFGPVRIEGSRNRSTAGNPPAFSFSVATMCIILLKTLRLEIAYMLK
jgi:hypothetical protein